MEWGTDDHEGQKGRVEQRNQQVVIGLPLYGFVRVLALSWCWFRHIVPSTNVEGGDRW